MTHPVRRALDLCGRARVRLQLELPPADWLFVTSRKLKWPLHAHTTLRVAGALCILAAAIFDLARDEGQHFAVALGWLVGAIALAGAVMLTMSESRRRRSRDGLRSAIDAPQNADDKPR
jgi:hypothetical protein